MKPNQLKQILFSVFVLAFGFTAVFLTSGFIEKKRPALPAGFEDEDLALQGANLKGYALGFEGLLADWYWMKSLQYIGDKIVKSEKGISMDSMKDLNPRLLYPYLDNATTLDPKFLSVYEYGAMILPAIDETQAVKIAKKGIDNNPNEWRLYHQLGYIYWKLENYEKASEIYGQGAKLETAPNWMRLMAAKMKSEGGSRETARAIYSQILEQATDEQFRESARLRLLQLDSLDEQDAIRTVLRNFQTKNGRCANDWREIFPLIQKVRLSNGDDLSVDSKSLAPVDPTNVPYILNRESGKCDVGINFAESKIPAQ